MARIYLIAGILALGAMGWAEYRGMSFARYDEVKSAPKSIRDNPGAYRGLYRQYFHK